MSWLLLKQFIWSFSSFRETKRRHGWLWRMQEKHGNDRMEWKVDGWKCRGRGECDSVSPLLLSCSNLCCLINSFYPSGWSDSSACPTRLPPPPQPHPAPSNLTCSALPLYCTPSSPLRPTCWARPPHSSLSAHHRAARKHRRSAVAMVTITPLPPQVATSLRHLIWDLPRDLFRFHRQNNAKFSH